MNIYDAVSQAGVVVKKVSSTKGGEWAGPCPGCGGRDRFRVWPAAKGGEGSYWCRGCGKGGDVVQFFVDFRGYPYRQAFEAAGREQPDNYRPARFRRVETPRAEQFEPRRFEPPVETWQLRAQALVDEAHQALLDSEKGMAWLARRGLDETAVRRFRLGYFAGENGKPQMYRPRTSWGLSEIIKDNGRKKMLWIPRGITIPTFKDGRVYQIRIRRPNTDLVTDWDRKTKYYIVPGSGMDVLGVNLDRPVLVVVESQLDGLMIARQAGSLVGVVALGSSTAKPGSTVFYHLKKAMRILVSLDHDENKAGQRAFAWWKKEFPQARPWSVPEGKDPGEAYEAGVDIKEWIRMGLPPVAGLDLQPKGYTPPKGVPPIIELRQLLEKYPVTIRAEKDGAEIILGNGFKNPAIEHRLRELFFEDEEVHYFLRLKHPDTVINGENCFVKIA